MDMAFVSSSIDDQANMFTLQSLTDETYFL